MYLSGRQTKYWQPPGINTNMEKIAYLQKIRKKALRRLTFALNVYFIWKRFSSEAALILQLSSCMSNLIYVHMSGLGGNAIDSADI